MYSRIQGLHLASNGLGGIKSLDGDESGASGTSVHFVLRKGTQAKLSPSSMMACNGVSTKHMGSEELETLEYLMEEKPSRLVLLLCFFSLLSRPRYYTDSYSHLR